MDKYLQVRSWLSGTGKKIDLRWTATSTLEVSYAVHKERIKQEGKLLLVSLLDQKNEELSTAAYTFIFGFTSNNYY